MKTNKLPQSAWSDSQEAGSQPMRTSQSSSYYPNDSKPQTSYASNDASYNHESSNDECSKNISLQDSCFGYKSAAKSPVKIKESAMIDHDNAENDDLKYSDINGFDDTNDSSAGGYKKPQKPVKNQPLMSEFLNDQTDALKHSTQKHGTEKEAFEKQDSEQNTLSSYKEIPERVFMNGLIKHTGIALAIIIPLAAFSAYAATPPVQPTAAPTNNTTTVETLSVDPSTIIHKSANTPTTVDSVDLKKYAGTWYEIGRLPMYFQRNCASDVTANYTEKTDGSGIIVTNKCADKDGSGIVAEGLAKPADDTGSKLKVTFLPSWIRWIPVGRADYWVLARDPDYKTALVGTPDKDYLWLLSRSPNISQKTYAKYRQVAQQQGYELKEFKLTPQTNQTVSLIP
ncbi:lipocalin family protein [Psychrobacter sp. AOP22-C1-22]|uniref:lipocalin family protein n=1 Tax=unclassified Psychrobacter TaxID=196806 RepID=UPI0017889856|nr:MULTISPECIES: lipocalin family protein [unclassified Psychrobacter]MBE0405398.1 lipocalin family protein [Psychrobacter sp. FME6]MBE0444322.1 lipocalin family protein [Psychrobacter sp. FME5]